MFLAQSGLFTAHSSTEYFHQVDGVGSSTPAPSLCLSAKPGLHMSILVLSGSWVSLRPVLSPTGIVPKLRDQPRKAPEGSIVMETGVYVCSTWCLLWPCAPCAWLSPRQLP